MEFEKLINERYSCRSYDSSKDVSDEIILKILEDTNLSPSACNGQPYYFTVCNGEKAKEIAKETTKMGMNKFAMDAPALIVVSEKPYVRSALVGSKIKNNDYRSMDIGIATAYLTLSAANYGVSTCILGWFEEEKIKEILNIKDRVRLVILLGYPKDDKKPVKKRKKLDEITNIG